MTLAHRMGATSRCRRKSAAAASTTTATVRTVCGFMQASTVLWRREHRVRLLSRVLIGVEVDTRFAVDHRHLTAATHVLRHQLVCRLRAAKLPERVIDELLRTGEGSLRALELAAIEAGPPFADMRVVDRDDVVSSHVPILRQRLGGGNVRRGCQG